jgi:polysaccharide biosynthesis PFTS motif protein
MVFSVIKKIVSQRAQRKLRRGIRIIKLAHKRDNNMWEGLSYLRLVSKTNIRIIPNTWLYGENNSEVELSARARTIIFKIALQPIIFFKVTKAIYDKKQNIYTSAPRVWRNKFRDLGFKTPILINDINWFIMQVRLLIKSVIASARMTRYSLVNKNIQPVQPYWIADLFPKNSFPSPDKNISQRRLIPFLEKISTEIPTGKNIWITDYSDRIPSQNGNVTTTPHIFPALESYTKDFQFFILSVCVISLSFLKWIMGSVGAPALAEDAVTLRYFNLLESKQLPFLYLRTHQDAAGKPIWIREAESKNINSLMVFYSANNLVMRYKYQNLPTQKNPEHLMLNWPNFIVRDQYQTKWLRSVVSNEIKTFEVGVMPFEESDVELAKFRSRTIVIFDITPVRDSYYVLHGERYGVLTNKYIIKFWQDIIKIGQQLDISFAVKPKRQRVSWTVTQQYRHTINQLNKLPNFIIIDPDVSALRLINQADAVISLPYTSTALDALKLGKPSIYYDPSKNLQDESDDQHDVSLIRGEDNLKQWIISLGLNSL